MATRVPIQKAEAPFKCSLPLSDDALHEIRSKLDN